MKLISNEMEGRIGHWIRTLKNDFYLPLAEISWEGFQTFDELTPEEAEAGTFEEKKPGFVWGECWEYLWLRADITLPAEAEGERIVLGLAPAGETTLFVNGEAFGTYRASWVREQHHFISDNALTTCGHAGETYHLLMEVYAGHFYPEAPGCACATGPVLPGAYEDTAVEGERRTLGTCTIGIWNETAYQLYMDVVTLTGLLKTLDEKSLRAVRIAEALETFTLLVDFEQERAGRIADYEKAREALAPVLTAKNGSTAPEIYAIGNAHLDLAWLWPMAETRRKTARTFAAQLRLLDEYPDYRFLQSQPASYEMCRERYPELFERIVSAAKDGRWIADGAMWVEPDTNMAGGEALIRQLLYGKRYYKEVFDVDSRILWLPDTFGYSGNLPQILKGCGVDYLVTQKIFWSYNDSEEFPYHYFTWKGIDGTDVTSFLPTSYTYDTDPVSIHNAWESRRQLRHMDSFLLPFGYGDGGGGPARDHLEYARRQADLEGGPKVRFASPLEFFEDMEQKGGPKDTWCGELYFTAHRGTYTTQAKIKKNNRRAELALRAMELWGALAPQTHDSEAVERLWKVVLLHQFHDILPGSGIARIYREAESAVGKAIDEALACAKCSMTALTADDHDAVSVFNANGFAHTEIVTLPDTFAEGAVTKDGTPVYTQKSADGVRALVTVPSFGAVSLRPAATGSIPHPVTVTEDINGFVMENDLLRVHVRPDGTLDSVVRLKSGREFAAEPMNRFHLYKDVPRIFDAWDIDSNYLDQEITQPACLSVRKVSDGLEGILEVTGTIGHSTLTQRIVLAACADRIDFVTEIDWHELHRLLKVSFPANVYAEEGINEIQFGYIRRPTHRSRMYDKDRFEVCNHRYSALFDGSHGAAVLNDCKYGISMNGNALELTLLRAAASPEMRSDEGKQCFTYAFLPSEGSFEQSRVPAEAIALNTPASIVDGCADFTAFAINDCDNVILDTVKLAEDGSGDLILRLYESKKMAGSARLTVNIPFTAASSCDMLENITEELTAEGQNLSLSFRPFEIRTIRLKR